MHETLPLLAKTDFPPIKRTKLKTLQVNLGYLCNQTCVHCHVNAGPKRTEIMDRETVDQIVLFLEQKDIEVLDLTGGAPEMNPSFRQLVSAANSLGVHVIDRCNLTVLHEKDQKDLALFLAQEKVEVVASLPCYLEENVDKQRGKGVFAKSISSLQLLNTLGYGQPDSGLKLNLVYNPQGAVLPPGQAYLEQAYKAHLAEQFDIVFNHLYTITNMPIKRFGSTLISNGQFDNYMQLLRDNYRPENLPDVMCRTTLSVDWQGYVYDCDFNQMLALPYGAGERQKKHLSDLFTTELTNKPIAIMDHCYGCTAGQGSSCGGSFE